MLAAQRKFTFTALTPDRFEANDTPATAADLGTLTKTHSEANLNIKTDDVDYFRFHLDKPGTAQSVAALDFNNRLGDLNLYLMDSNGNLLNFSMNENVNHEEISLAGLARGDYLLQVKSSNHAINPDYTLTLGNLADTNDTLTGSKKNDVLHGGVGNDQISGGDGNDQLFGEYGNDRLYGKNGDDLLDGGMGYDKLTGGTGNDTLQGGPGTDTLTGNQGADRFVFSASGDSGRGAAGRDVISDFSHAEGDKIDLHLLDADATRAGIQAWTFINGNFTTEAGQVRFDSVNHLLQFDGNGDAQVDFEIALTGVPNLVEMDFVLV